MPCLTPLVLMRRAVILGFSTALLGLMPALNNTDPWATDGAFFFPYWAMFGEYGEVNDFAVASIYWGPINWGSVVIWAYNFFSQVLLVNLLIAMMSETYSRIKRNADDEWKFKRVAVVDEFASSGCVLPRREAAAVGRGHGGTCRS